MKLGFSKQLVLSTPDRWERQYRDTTDPKKVAITEALQALDATKASPAEVAGIIGNQSWSYFTCDECDQHVERIVELGQDERTVTICPSCLRAASALASAVLP